MSKGCANCKYKNFPPDAVPCADCEDGDEYEPIEGSENDE